MIELLYAHSILPERTRRHALAPGDPIGWDNRCVLHRADHDGVIGDRTMHRGIVTEASAYARNAS